MMITFALLVAFIAWLAYAMRDPAMLPATPVQAALPQDFIWGVSSSGYQSEGGAMDSNWTRLNALHPERDEYGTSVDFRHRYREDVALAKAMGINTYRIGINWARVEPKKGQIDEAEMAYYDDVILALKQAGITPLITLDHFVHPGWVADQGGWTNPQTTKDFVVYSSMIAKRYHHDVRLWITFNEEGTYQLLEAFQYKRGLGKILGARDNLVAAHRETYDVIHALDPTAMVTSNIIWMGDHLGSGFLQGLTDWMFLDRIEDKCDVIAIDYYAANLPRAIKNGKQWGIFPEPAGIYRALKTLKARYPNKPLLIAEAGMPTEDGQPRDDGVTREDLLRDSVYWVQRAREDGINVVGFMVWSLTDNFEWGSYTPRFGLYTVNVKTDPSLTRIPTAAVPAYQEIIRIGGVGPSYRPVIAQY
ncbi:MAG: family 1 glycosylhydrolase [Pseudomonadota bacterium]